MDQIGAVSFLFSGDRINSMQRGVNRQHVFSIHWGLTDIGCHMLLVMPDSNPLTTTSRNHSQNELISRKASLAYPIRDGVPIMLVDEARRLD